MLEQEKVIEQRKKYSSPGNPLHGYLEISERNVSQVRKPQRGRSEAERLDGHKRRDKLPSRRGLEVIEDSKLIAEKKFVELKKCRYAKMSYRQELLRFVGDKSINVYIS